MSATLNLPPLEVVYTNFRGETALRRIIPGRAWHGKTEHHPEPQWLMDVWDVEKGAERTYAMKDMRPAAPMPNAVTDTGQMRVPHIPGVDSQVVTAAAGHTPNGNPEWLWYDREQVSPSFSRWHSAPGQAAYVRLDLVLATLEADAGRGEVESPYRWHDAKWVNGSSVAQPSTMLLAKDGHCIGIVTVLNCDDDDVRIDVCRALSASGNPAKLRRNIDAARRDQQDESVRAEAAEKERDEARAQFDAHDELLHQCIDDRNAYRQRAVQAEAERDEATHTLEFVEKHLTARLEAAEAKLATLEADAGRGEVEALKDDLERQMTIANAETNRAEAAEAKLAARPTPSASSRPDLIAAEEDRLRFERAYVTASNNMLKVSQAYTMRCGDAYETGRMSATWRGWQLARAAFASEPEPQPVAEGWVLVPVEPTQTMIDAGLIEGSDDPEHEASCIGHQWVRREIYQAMVMRATSLHLAEEPKA